LNFNIAANQIRDFAHISVSDTHRGLILVATPIFLQDRRIH
jgi:hypothetical protein